MKSLRLACHAMGTRFEAVVYGHREEALRAATEEAFEEIKSIEARLSVYRPESLVSRVNQRAAGESVRLDAVTFRLVEQAKYYHALAGGLFDPTIGPLLRCWGLRNGAGRVPNRNEIAQAKRALGFDLVELDPENQAVRFLRNGVELDFGAVGKGYALDRAAEILIEAGVESALLHGGTSTALAIGVPPEEEHWKVAVSTPDRSRFRRDEEGGAGPLAVVALANASLSVSAVSGKGFQFDDRFYGHVLDPRTGYPVSRWEIAAVRSGSAAASDALSTALLVGGPDILQKSKEASVVDGYLVATGKSGFSEPELVRQEI